MFIATTAGLRRKPLAACLASAVLFAGLAVIVAMGAADDLDNAIRNAIHAAAAPWLTRIAEFVTQFGSTAALLLFCAAVAGALCLMHNWRAAVFLTVTLTGTMLGNTGLKWIFQRSRPEAYFGDVIASFSFPSGHSAFSCAFYLVAATIAAHYAKTKPARIAILAAASLLVAAIGLSRVYLGVHYPTDVLGGYLVAIFCVSLATMSVPWRPREDSNLRPTD